MASFLHRHLLLQTNNYQLWAVVWWLHTIQTNIPFTISPLPISVSLAPLSHAPLRISYVMHLIFIYVEMYYIFLFFSRRFFCFCFAQFFPNKLYLYYSSSQCNSQLNYLYLTCTWYSFLFLLRFSSYVCYFINILWIIGVLVRTWRVK